MKFWLEHTIIKFDFCPFAKREFVKESIAYHVVDSSDKEQQLTALAEQLKSLDDYPEIQTTLIIFPVGLESFFDYIDFLEIANQLNHELGYEGVYQLASFHPDYCFENVKQDDPSNFTNRSPYPIIHILRESSIERALMHYDNPEKIPERNMEHATKLGSKVFLDVLACSREG
ncbi:MAG: DUF1415 domain-containing protein [Kangiellaceae bacterium]|nr:DUF1415 domain-containing protein [Kangiellaceae bacterium]